MLGPYANAPYLVPASAADDDEMNEPVRLNLIRIIDGLEALEDADGR